MNIKSIVLMTTASSFALTGCGGGAGSDPSPIPVVTNTPVVEEVAAPEEVVPVVEESAPEVVEAPVVQTCTVSDVPHYGSAILIEGQELVKAYKLANTNSQDFNLYLEENEYGYFAYPAALGTALFVDNDNTFEGGWDGATWAIDGSIGLSNDPLVVEVDGTDWFVYRTDWPQLGAIDFNIEFQNSGLLVGDTVTCDTSAYPRIDTDELTFDIDTNVVYVDGTPEPTPEPEPEVPVDGMCSVSERPRFGASMTNVWSESGVDALANVLIDTESQNFNLNLGVGEYGVFAYPAALGTAMFTDVANGFEGGWDGASWNDDGSFGMASDPIVVQKDGTDWFVYRTDFTQLGAIEFTVTFSNAGELVGTSIACDNSIYPEVNAGTVNDNALTVVYVYNEGDYSTPIATGTVVDGEFELNTTYLTDGDYSLYFATAAAAGTVYGPATVTVSDGELTTTDFDTSSWSVTFN